MNTGVHPLCLGPSGNLHDKRYPARNSTVLAAASATSNHCLFMHHIIQTDDETHKLRPFLPQAGHTVCAEQGPLSAALTKACVDRFDRGKDAQFLLPAIPGMQKPHVLQVGTLFHVNLLAVIHIDHAVYFTCSVSTSHGHGRVLVLHSGIFRHPAAVSCIWCITLHLPVLVCALQDSFVHAHLTCCRLDCMQIIYTVSACLQVVICC